MTVVVSPSTLPGQSSIESPKGPIHYGWFLGIKVGVGYGRAACDSPCYSPRARFGPHVDYALGHTVGNRSRVGLSFGGFTGRFASPRDVWSLGGIGLDVAARPSPMFPMMASMELGPGSWEREPKRGGHGVAASVLQWRLGVAHDDPTTSTWGAFAQLHGSLGGAISHSENEDGSRVRAIGLSIGPAYVRR